MDGQIALSVVRHSTTRCVTAAAPLFEAAAWT
jgi:hypothetical protein